MVDKESMIDTQKEANEITRLLLDELDPLAKEYPSDPNAPKQFVAQAHWCGTDENTNLYFECGNVVEGWASSIILKSTPSPVVTTAGAQKVWTGQKQHVIEVPVVKGASSHWPPIDGRTALPPLWPESIIKDWNQWPSSVRNELRNEGWSLRNCQKIVKTDAYRAWRRERTTEALEPIRDMLPEALSPQAPLGGSEEWPGVYLIIDKGEYIPGVRDSQTFEYHLSKSEYFDGQIVIDLPTEEIEKDYILKPYPQENACRLNSPGKYDKFRRGSRVSGGKTYHIIYGHNGKTDKWEEQAYRYPKDGWTVTEAKKHCKDHDGMTFEPAVEGE